MLYAAIAINTIAIIISIVTINILQKQNSDLQNDVENVYKSYLEIKEKYNKLTTRLETVKISDIKIDYWFIKTPPKQSKMQNREKYLLENGEFKSLIILNKNNKLLDGYTSYLLAKKYNIQNVEVIKK